MILVFGHPIGHAASLHIAGPPAPRFLGELISQLALLTVWIGCGPGLFGRAFLSIALDLWGAGGLAAAPVAFFALSE